jgi:hypothetical protein
MIRAKASAGKRTRMLSPGAAAAAGTVLKLNCARNSMFQERERRFRSVLDLDAAAAQSRNYIRIAFAVIEAILGGKRPSLKVEIESEGWRDDLRVVPLISF